MSSSDESEGLKLLLKWKRTVELIQLHLALADRGVTFTMNGSIAPSGIGCLHLIGPGHPGAIGADCEAIIDFEEESLKASSENTLEIRLKNGDTIFLSESRKPMPE
jgi:hypothetical protein